MKLFDRIGRLVRTQSRRRAIEPGLERFEDRTLLSSIYTVTNNSDNPAMEGSLPFIVNEINHDATPGVDTIHFGLSPNEFAIDLASNLRLTHPVLIDGTSQPGYSTTNPVPLITISEASGNGSVDGFVLAAGSDNSTIQGLSIVNFGGAAINVQSSEDKVVSSYLGVTPTGGNAGNGVGVLLSNAPGSTIGGTTLGAANIIGFNTVAGVLLSGSSNDLVLGNYIGTDPFNDQMGNKVGIEIDGSSSNSIGGTVSGTVGGTISGSLDPNQPFPSGFTETLNYSGSDVQGGSISGTGLVQAGIGNIIDFNQGAGIAFSGTASSIGGSASADNVVMGNLIGVNVVYQRESSGQSSPQIENAGNLSDGIDLNGNGNDGVQSNTIGFANTLPYIASSIGGTITPSVTVAGPFGTATLQTFPPQVVTGLQTLYGTLAVGNIIGDNDGAGVYITDSASQNVVLGNTIGATSSGAANSLGGNSGNGISISNSFGNTIGGFSLASTASIMPLTAAANVVSGNAGDGIAVSSASLTDSANLIAGNLVASNAGNGIHFIGDLSAGSPQVQISNNLVGTTFSGSSTVDVNGILQGNGLDGIKLEQSATSVSGGGNGVPSATVAYNVSSGNGQNGIHVQTASVSTESSYAVVSIVGNHVGTDISGSLVSASSSDGPISFGNGLDGILLNEIRGVAITNNLVSGNRANGIDLLQSQQVAITGNRIGTDINGSSSSNEPAQDFGNAANGILLDQSDQITIGGTVQGAANIISGNHSSGVFVAGTTVTDIGVTGATSNNNLVEGNLIGVGYKAGNQITAIPNAVAGVILSNANSNTLGGSSPRAANLISGNSLDGIVLVNDASDNAILNNLIGTNPTATDALGNLTEGIFLLGTSAITISGVTPNTTASTISGNTIGSNVIAGNGADGIRVFGLGVTDNAMTSNWIGLSPTGTRIANGSDGVLLSDAGPANVVGGVGLGNIISGNDQAGVAITGSPTSLIGTAVRGNFIGTDPSGNYAVGNGTDGVLVYGSSANTIGGATGSPGTAPGNVIAGNVQAGIQIINPGGMPASNNQVVGNLIGTNAAGNSQLGNGTDGVQIQNASSNVIGGAFSIDRNVISGNSGNGLLIIQSPKLSATGNQVLGNFIGTNAAGSAGLGNMGSGVLLIDGSANVVGGIGGGVPIPGTEVPTGAGPGNLISGNNQWGVWIQLTGAAAGQPQSLIQGNIIGLGLAESTTSVIGNGKGGILINNVTAQPLGQTIGGSVAGAGNLITGNANVGIELVGPQAGGSGTNDVVQGNLIGLDATGNLVNVAGSATGNGTGIWVDNSPNDLIGDTSPAGRNVISGNSQAGIELSDVLSTGDRVLGNFIGTNLGGNGFPFNTSERAPGQGIGVFINGGSGNTVGQDATGANNVISGNEVGVQISGIAQSNGQFIGSGNIISGNFVGTSASGTGPLPNRAVGVLVDNSPGNLIGPGNVMSANGIAGVEIFEAGSQQNLVTDNTIGEGKNGEIFSSAGQTRISSNGSQPGIPVYTNAQLNGVVILGASQNTIGLNSRIPGSARNTISGNVQVGVYITSHDFQGNVYTVPINNSVSANIIRSDGTYGVLFYNAPGNLAPPYIGTSQFLATNQFGAQKVNFRNYQTGSRAAVLLTARGSNTNPHLQAAHVLQRSKPRPPTLRDSSVKR